jgi:hypothetical protein
VVQLEIHGGVPPFAVDLKVDGGPNLWDPITRTVPLSGVPPGGRDLLQTVVDAAPEPGRQSYVETIALTVTAAPTTAPAPGGAPADRTSTVGDLPPVTLMRAPPPATRSFTQGRSAAPSGGSGSSAAERLRSP